MNRQSLTKKVRSSLQGREPVIVAGLLAIILAAGAFLRFYNLGQSGQLRFVLGDALDRHQAIATWMKQNCTDGAVYGGTTGSGSGGFNGASSNSVLYQCGG